MAGLSKELSRTMKPSLDYLPSIELTIFVTGKKNKNSNVEYFSKKSKVISEVLTCSIFKQSVVYLVFQRSSGSNGRDADPRPRTSIKNLFGVFLVIFSLSCDKNERKCSGAGTNYSLLG